MSRRVRLTVRLGIGVHRRMAVRIVDSTKPAAVAVFPENIGCLSFDRRKVLRRYNCGCENQGGIARFKDHHSGLSHLQRAFEVMRNVLHGAPNLNLSDGVRAGLDYEHSVVRVEIDDSVEVLVVDRPVRFLDQKRDGVLAYCHVLEMPNKTKLTGPPPPTLATIDARTGGSG